MSLESRRRRPRQIALATALGGAAILTVLLLAATSFTPGSGFTAEGGLIDHLTEGLFHGGTTHVEWSLRGEQLSFQVRGKARFAEDDRAVVSISPGGSVALRHKASGVLRRLRVEPGPDGDLRYRYRIGRREQAFDEAAQAWFAEILPYALQQSGIGVEARVRRWLGEGGLERTLTTIEAMRGEWAQARHLSQVLVVAQPQGAELNRWFAAFESVSPPDHERHRLLEEVMEAVPVRDLPHESLLRIAAAFESDYHRAGFLEALISTGEMDEAQAGAVLTAATALNESYHLAQVLQRLSEEPGLSAAAYGRLLDESLRLEGYGRHELLRQIVGEMPWEEVTVEAYRRAAASFDEEYYRNEQIRALLDGRREPGVVGLALDLVAGLDSDYRLAEGLEAVAEELPVTGDDLDTYLEVAGGLRSDEFLVRALEALLEESELSQEERGRVVDFGLRRLQEPDRQERWAQRAGRELEERAE